MIGIGEGGCEWMFVLGFGLGEQHITIVRKEDKSSCLIVQFNLEVEVEERRVEGRVSRSMFRSRTVSILGCKWSWKNMTLLFLVVDPSLTYHQRRLIAIPTRHPRKKK